MPEGSLFAYGTLRDPDILRAVLGRTPPSSDIRSARAAGHAAVFYPGRPYPALVRSSDADAVGLVLSGLTLRDWVALDAFEGTEYQRGHILVTTDAGPTAASAYLATMAVPNDAPAWRLEDWQRLYKPLVLADEIAAAQTLRARLFDSDHESVSPANRPA